MKWQTGEPVQGQNASDYYLCYTIDNLLVPVVLIYIYSDKQWTSGGGDTQKVYKWMPIPPVN